MTRQKVISLEICKQTEGEVPVRVVAALDADVVAIPLDVVEFININRVSLISDDVKQETLLAKLGDFGPFAQDEAFNKANAFFADIDVIILDKVIEHHIGPLFMRPGYPGTWVT